MRLLVLLAFILLLWMPDRASSRPKDIIVTVVDHWEPRTGWWYEDALPSWSECYPQFADRHRDSDGKPLQHSWFFWNCSDWRYWTMPDSGQIHSLLDLAFRGYGEIDLHVHHEENGDQLSNYSSFQTNMRSFIRTMRQYGVAITAEEHPRTRFGFIHGMWALDNSYYCDESNSGNPTHRFCGVNQELRALNELGCFADFTLPSWGVMDSYLIKNQCFYVRDDDRAKSYGNPRNACVAEVHGRQDGDLLLFAGPYWPRPSTQILDNLVPASFDAWVSCNVHVKGNDDWVFVKLHTHGLEQARLVSRDEKAEGTSALWGDIADLFWNYVETRYNDGTRYRLHYVTAREAYNILRAAEAGLKGNPNLYRDFEIPPYAHTRLHVSCRYRLESWTEKVVVFSLRQAVSRVFADMHVGDREVVAEEFSKEKGWSYSDALFTSVSGDVRLDDQTPSESYRLTFLSRADRHASGSSAANVAVAITGVSPNPSHGDPIAFRLALRRNQPVSLEVFNVLGQLVRTLVECNGERSTQVMWDGRDRDGRLVPTGVYVCRVSTPEWSCFTRVTILR
ncbi:MAG TPA: hypothetical protein PLE60_01055 [Candidatus Latescibacteria bacterium]|nr:hypothetical protein [Candidatus Latescibacterota bacterium]